MSTEESPPTLTVICPKCRATTYPITVSMDDAGQLIDDPLDYADMWAHHWTHSISWGRL